MLMFHLHSAGFLVLFLYSLFNRKIVEDRCFFRLLLYSIVFSCAWFWGLNLLGFGLTLLEQLFPTLSDILGDMFGPVLILSYVFCFAYLPDSVFFLMILYFVIHLLTLKYRLDTFLYDLIFLGLVTTHVYYSLPPMFVHFAP